MTPASDANAELSALARTQDNIVSRAQLSALGWHRHTVTRRVRAGQWQTVGPRVVALVTGTLTRRQQFWVAVLHSGPVSALAGVTAAESLGLRGFSSTIMHTVVPHGHGARSLDSGPVRVAVRQSRYVSEQVVLPGRLPRRVRLPYAVVDAASRMPGETAARLIVISSVQQRLVVPADLRGVLDGRQRIRRQSLIRESIDDVEGGAHSLPERTWCAALVRYGLPEPGRQVLVERPTGSWVLDADFTPYGVGVEIDGIHHERVAQSGFDNHRRNVLATGGRMVLTFDSYAVRHNLGAVVVATAAALLSRGWTPPPDVRRGLEVLAARERMSLLTGDWLATG